MMKFLIIILANLIYLTNLHALSYLPGTDCEVSAHDLKTGQLIWTYHPGNMTSPNIFVYDQGLVIEKFVFKYYDIQRSQGGSNKHIVPDRDFLNPDSGMIIQPFDTTTSPIIQSSHPGKTATWNNFVYTVADFYSNEQGNIYAYSADQSARTWQINLNDVFEFGKPVIRHASIQVLAETLYIASDEYIVAAKPATGNILWKKDLATDLEISKNYWDYGGALCFTLFAQSGDILIISSGERVVALDLKNDKYLWHLNPHWMPNCPAPVIYQDKVYLPSRQVDVFSVNK